VFGSGGAPSRSRGGCAPPNSTASVPVLTGAHGGGTLVASCGGIYPVAGKSDEAAAAAFGWMFVF